MKIPRNVKRYFASSKTTSRWWHPESKSPKENPFLPFRDIFVREASDVIAMADPRSKLILDAGIGDGRISNRLADAGAGDICALDISHEMLTTASHAREIDLSRVEFVRGDIECLPLRDSTFEVILCIQTLVHVPRPEIALAELARVTVPGGRILVDITNTNVWSVFYYFRSCNEFISFLNTTLRFVALYLPYGPLKGMGGPWRQYSPVKIERAAKELGLKMMCQEKYFGKKPVYTLFEFHKSDGPEGEKH